ncbi:MAG: pyruvate kinase [candidate division Zixibacteria bacterium]|nr:pyruvate kinase [candidate division Zixibacteria bacterium]
MKKTKILATYGPAIQRVSHLKRLIAAGVNAFRINCSHGVRTDFVAAARAIGEARKSARYPVGILFDISGPKLRLARFEGEVRVRQGDRITVTAGNTDTKAGILGVNHPAIIKSVKKGERLFIDDGQVLFDITKTGPEQIEVRAQNAGILTSAKGINLPDTAIGIPTITAKDRRDIRTAVEVDADYIALSFVRSGDDVIEARRLIRKYGGRQAVIAKLEKREAIDVLEEVMILSDGVMVARGDLGVELPPAELPRLQKRIVRLANRHRKPVIVATQMLESMRFSPRATRAEISDVASAVFESVDAVMLSAETATGKYPLETVRTMNDVITATEEACRHQHLAVEQHLMKSPIPYAIAEAVSGSDRFCESDAIFAFTTSGYTAGLISNRFPSQPIIALTPDRKVMNQLTLCRSVYSVQADPPSSFNAVLDTINAICRKHRLVRKGGRVIITGGVPFGTTTWTNFMLIHEVG